MPLAQLQTTKSGATMARANRPLRVTQCLKQRDPAQWGLSLRGSILRRLLTACRHCRFQTRSEKIGDLTA